MWAGFPNGEGGVIVIKFRDVVKLNNNLDVDLGFMKIKNPVMPASGCFGFGKEYSEYYNLDILGAIVVKATTTEVRKGNLTPRIAETPAGMLNSIGLQNPGVDKVLSDELVWLEKFTSPIIVNIAGSSLEDYVEVARRLNDAKNISALEVNISCPNVKAGGLAFGTDPIIAGQVIAAVKKVSNFPIIAKLSPNVTSVVEIARSVEAAGADSISLINTLLGLAIDTKKQKPILANIAGGLSGPAVKPIGLRMVWEVSSSVKVPVIGIGGIMDGNDAIEYLLAGASAVQVGTANFTNSYACPDIIQGIDAYMTKYNIENLSSIIGKAKE